MYDNEIYTFELDFFDTKPTKKKLSLCDTHKLLKKPSFTELNKRINEYPSSPPNINNQSRPASTGVRKSRVPTSTSRERCTRTPEDYLKECTFKPTISKSHSKKTLKVPLEKKLQLLAKSKRDTIENREKAKLKKEIEEAASYPYTPEISNYNLKSKFSYEKQSQTNKYEELEKLKRQQELEKESECTFHPKIINKTNSQTIPLHERIDQIQIQKLKSSYKLRQKYDIDLSFKPQINSRSRALSTQRKTSTDIGSESTKKGLSHAGSSKEIICSDISPIRIPKREFYDHSEFFNRQDEHINRKNSNIKTRQEAQNESLTFTPMINKQSSIIADNNTSPKTIIKRMREMSDNNVLKMQRQNAAREAFYAKFPFAPEINEVSQKIGRSSSIEKLTEDNIKKKNIDRKVEEICQDDMKNCTFSPKINPKKFHYLKSSYGQDGDIMKRIEEEDKEKREKNRRMKFEKEFEEAKCCSFRPEISREKNKFEKKTSVKGLDRYFELKQMAKRISVEKEEQEKNAFAYTGGCRKLEWISSNVT
ncbi:hypothetical protein SteCoe_5743 [Stentor coeruleus]|uniref:Uncharacterized protein n=1 Tax=Stentor coeruleus TaxID=5963 RepID=A0A1R2CRS3_9CILI|nr:hypothetical protein SteCoe_5743 [Stentor coeruleus]